MPSLSKLSSPAYILRMIRFIFMCFAALLPALVLAGCRDNPDVIAKVEAARARNDGPPIWVVTKPGPDIGKLYIFGSVHILPKDFDWQKPDLTEIFNKSGTVFFETPQDKAAQNEAAVIIARNGYYSAPKSLPDVLDGYNQTRLMAATLDAGLDAGALDKFQPWLAADMLSLATLEKAGLSGAHGADNMLHAKAKARGKYIRYLETTKAHYEATEVLSPRLQKAGLIDTLDSLSDMAEQTRLLNTAWASGNAKYIEIDILAPLRAGAPEYYDALFTRRNERWAAVLDDFVDGGDEGLAVVGVGHMVGEGSLAEKLEARGLTVKRHYAFLGENVIKTIPLDMGN